MSPALWAASLVAAQRLAELVWARRNTRRLRVAGAVEHGAGHYPLLVLLHGAWLAALALLTPAHAPVHWPVIGVYLALQPLRLWIIASLGECWTTRVLVVPGRAPVRRGPYRWLRHPNYLVVAAEIALLPLAFGAWGTALVFTVLNALLTAHRVRVENAALATAADG